MTSTITLTLYLSIALALAPACGGDLTPMAVWVFGVPAADIYGRKKHGVPSQGWFGQGVYRVVSHQIGYFVSKRWCSSHG
jgi:hypothetical protein